MIVLSKYVAYAVTILLLSAVSPAQSDATRFKVEMDSLAERGQFNGSVLVAEKGKVLYQNGFGMADFANGIPFTPDTPCYLGSVSKQFTAMAIMMLQERGKLSYDDTLAKYFPELPSYSQKITIRHLLNHTSGLPDYFQLGVGRPGVTNQDVLSALIKTPELRFPVGDKFEYSNSGYLLLSLIVEKASGQTFRAFLQKNVFGPLGMKNSFVHDKSAPLPAKRAIGYGRLGEASDYDIFTTGDGGIYSTANDLFRWDKALYTERLVKKATLAEAFRTIKLPDGEETDYGFGWAIRKSGDETSFGHSGGLAGFRTHIERFPQSQRTIIFLTNKSFNSIGSIRNVLAGILFGKPYKLPKLSIAETMYKAYGSTGIDSAVKLYTGLQPEDKEKYELGVRELNYLGYRLLNANDIPAAIRVFKLNVEKFPTEPNPYDSLGEAYMKNGDRDQAILNYKKSLELEPRNTNAVEMLKKLETPPKPPSSPN